MVLIFTFFKIKLSLDKFVYDDESSKIVSMSAGKEKRDFLNKDPKTSVLLLSALFVKSSQ